MEKLTPELLDQKLQSGEAFVVDYHATWCEACRDMIPVIREVQEEYPDIPFYEVDIDEQPELKNRAKIKAIPMMMMYKGGRVREFVYGKTAKDIIERKLGMVQRI